MGETESRGLRWIGPQKLHDWSRDRTGTSRCNRVLSLATVDETCHERGSSSSGRDEDADCEGAGQRAEAVRMECVGKKGGATHD